MDSSTLDQPSAGNREAGTHRNRVESILLSRGVITEELLDEAKARQKGAKRPLVEVLLEQEAVDEDLLVRVLAEVTGMQLLPREALIANPDVQHLVPTEMVQRHGILPLSVTRDELIVATADPFQVEVFDDLARMVNLRIRPVFAKPSVVREVIRKARKGEEDLDDLLKNSPVPDDAVLLPAPADGDGRSDGEMDLNASPDDAPMVRLLNMIISDGIRQEASDIHIESERECVRVRFRVDGQLRDVLTLPDTTRGRLLARVKIVAVLNIIENRKPQDGRAKAVLNGKLYDLRISTLPSYFGEKAVIRILDSSAPSFHLDRSGIQADVLDQWRSLLHRPQGLLLLTGPTGSGKSTTLYASILELRDPSKNIVAIEDPVEYQFQGIVHVPIRTEIGMTFSAALRSVLRQDPDVVLLGEIRDKETAEVALRAAMTGHLVLSTLHTNDAVGAISRLLDLGATPKLLASCLLGVMGQRLVRTVCPNCAEPYTYPTQDLLALSPAGLPADAEPFHTQHGVGCGECRGTGMRGRSAIVELVRGTPGLRSLVATAANEGELYAQALADGMNPLVHSGLLKVLSGISTPEAVSAVAAAEVGAANAGKNGETADAVPVASMDSECIECGKALDASWKLCPFCGTAVPEGDGPTVVVCDDSEMDRKIVGAALRELFPRIEEAENGEAGLAAVLRVQPDVLVIDQSMPGMSGIDVILELRSHLETVSLPILMLTAGPGGDGLEFDALDAGADDYLRKPVVPARLRARVKALVKARARTAAPASAE